MQRIISFLFALLLVALLGVHGAEIHTVHFVNRCNTGTPKLVQGNTVLASGSDYTSHVPLIGAKAYLQIQDPIPLLDRCGLNGSGCTTVETNLVNPTSPGSGSRTDISLALPYKYSVKTGFGYYAGCDGAGASCGGENCNAAMKQTTDTYLQVACERNNVNLIITFC
ncbi:hypothetical protein CPC08DRAFT_722703 [Agrocybe pediades]|nr:hypothetical protein CPC08DRAFT_722703 [Agrocybe pediades]